MATVEGWAKPPSVPELLPGVVHVWRALLVQKDPVLARLEQLLSREERERASRFHFEKDRRSFVVARGVLRDILSRYLVRAAGSLVFEYTEYGKPYIAPEVNENGICFNLSHSGEFALYAITLKTRVGIDVERIRPDFAGLDIAERYFSQTERAALSRLKNDAQTRAFFDCWARKEAFMKADGRGLSLGLDQFDVSLSPGAPARLLRAKWDAEIEEKWCMHALDVHAGYAAALAAECPACNIEQWRWEAGPADSESLKDLRETKMAVHAPDNKGV